MALAGWIWAAGALCGSAAEAPGPADPAAARLDAAVAELAALRETITNEKLPLAKELSRLENEHTAVRQEDEALRRRFDQRTVDKGNLTQEIRRLEGDHAYLANLFAEYARNFESRLHIAELNRYEVWLARAKAAQERGDAPPVERYVDQFELITAAVRRLDGLSGIARFDGRASGVDGLVVTGRFAMVGPVAYFASGDGTLAGIAEQRLGSLEPMVAPFVDAAHTQKIHAFLEKGAGELPLDASLGNARKIEETEETLIEHIIAGGPVMVPIMGLALLVALLALGKGIALGLVRLPTAAQMEPLLAALRRAEYDAARATTESLKGPAGRMLAAGAKHLGGTKDLIEEAMYERMLESRLLFNRGLPFIAVGAATAPLLGLLGTVTGIITTFKLITVFGSGDVKMLSAGISEALITTEYGLLIAIPALLVHAFLSRKARTFLDRMEQCAVRFMGALEEGRKT
jgi:biopolymer transport protein ExbB